MVRFQCVMATIVISLVNTAALDCSFCATSTTPVNCVDDICSLGDILCMNNGSRKAKICWSKAASDVAKANCYNSADCIHAPVNLGCSSLSECCFLLGQSVCNKDCDFSICPDEISTPMDMTSGKSSSTDEQTKSTTSFSSSSNPSTTLSYSTNVNTASTTSFTTSYSLSTTLSTLSNDSTNTSADSSVPSRKSDSKTGLIIGVVIAGGVVIIALVLIILVLIIIRRSRARKRIEMQAGNKMESDCERMKSKEIEPPTSRYEAMNLSPAKQDLESNHQMELNDHINRESVTDTGYDNACELDEGYDNIGIDVLSEPSPAYEVVQNPTGKNISSGEPVPPGDSSPAYAVVHNSTGKNISPPGDSSETVLFDNQFYGENSFKVPSSSDADKGDTTVIDNALYGR